MKNISFFLFILFSLFFLFSCKKPDITPVYLILTEEDFKDCIDVSNFNSVHDENYDPNVLDVIKQHTFPFVRVSILGNMIGFYQPPCTIPMLPDYSKQNNIMLEPCVRLPNTVLSTEPYYFVNYVEKFFNFEKEDTIRFPSFKLEYRRTVKYELLETFANSTRFEARSPEIYPTTIELVFDEEKNKNLGTIVLKDTAKFFDIVTDYFLMNGKNERQYFEITYKSNDGEMFVSLNFKGAPTGTTNRDLVILPSSNGVWKQLYVNISEIMMQESYTASTLNTRLQITGNKTSDDKNADFYFDNIRIITMAN